MSFINYATNANNDSGTTLVVNKPTSTTDNDIMFAFFSGNEQPTAIPSGWTQLATETYGTNYNHRLWYKIASSEGSNYTWTFNSGIYRTITIATWRGGFDTSNPISVVGFSAYHTSDTNCRVPSMDIIYPNSTLLFFGGLFNLAAQSFTKPSIPTTDWVEHFDSGSATYRFFQEICSMVWTSSGSTGTIDATMSVSSAYKCGFGVILRPINASTSKFFQFF